MFNLLKSQKGYVAFFITILILSAMLGIALSITILILSAEQISANIVKSTQAYYAAEAGIEDSLLRIINPEIEYSDSNSFSVGGATVTISIEKLSTSLTVQSQGDFAGRIRRLEIKAQISTNEASFHYGVQVGEGGLIMQGNSQVLGNVYSNGPIVGASNTRIYGDVYSAGSTGLIDSLKVFKSEPEVLDGNAYSHTISNSNIENGAYYQVISDTVASTYYPGSPDPEPEDLPVSEEQITNWKNEAAEGGTISGYSLGSNEEDWLGPVKVVGDFTMDSNSILTQRGTIWVTGDIILDSNIVIQLDNDYGSDSGLIIADGKIFLGSNVIICGSEGYKKSGNKCYDNTGSFLMFLSTNSSLDPSSPAIESTSNSEAAVLYTNQGLIRLDSNAQLKEVTGYALYFDSNAMITYESGLADIRFISGPGGGWEIIRWQEIE